MLSAPREFHDCIWKMAISLGILCQDMWDTSMASKVISGIYDALVSLYISMHLILIRCYLKLILYVYTVKSLKAFD